MCRHLPRGALFELPRSKQRGRPRNTRLQDVASARPQCLNAKPVVSVHHILPLLANKSIGLYMTTPSSGTVKVFGVLIDPAFLCHQTVSSSETIDAVVDSLWKTVDERADENHTAETPPSVVQIALGEIGPFTPFKVLTCFHGCQKQISPSWSQPRRLSPP